MFSMSEFLRPLFVAGPFRDDIVYAMVCCLAREELGIEEDPTKGAIMCEGDGGPDPDDLALLPPAMPGVALWHLGSRMTVAWGCSLGMRILSQSRQLRIGPVWTYRPGTSLQ